MDRESKTCNIPGTRLNSQCSQLNVSFGITTLDELLGGGLPLGTVTLLEEDIHGSYSKTMLKYFLAEGIADKHATFVASQDLNPFNLIKELPAVIESDPEPSKSTNNQAIIENDKMKIAFRYQNLPTSEKETTQIFGHNFDLTKTMSLEDTENSDICYWNGQRLEKVPACTFQNPAYSNLLKSIKDKIKDGKFFLKDNPRKKSVLRIGIHSLGSPMWLPHRKLIHSTNRSQDLDVFIFCLRALVRSANAVALVTIPTHLYHESSLERCIHSSDIAMRLQAFSGTELENNPSLSDYHGFFYLTKVAAINTLANKHPGSVEYAFKLRRKKFSIEKLHLPPDIQDSNDTRKDSIPSLGCGSSNKHLLEF